MKYLQLKILIMLFFYTSVAFSQGTGINETGASAHSSAILDIDQNNSGLLIPRMTTEEIQAIHAPANGLWVFNTTESRFYLFISNDNQWKELAFEEESPESQSVRNQEFINIKEQGLENAENKEHLAGKQTKPGNDTITEKPRGSIMPK